MQMQQPGIFKEVASLRLVHGALQLLIGVKHKNQWNEGSEVQCSRQRSRSIQYRYLTMIENHHRADLTPGVTKVYCRCRKLVVVSHFLFILKYLPRE